MSELDFLWTNALIAASSGDRTLLNLTSPVALLNYIRIANQIAHEMPGGRILDWGCGYGQLSYLLQRRGFEVVSYDTSRASRNPRLPLAQAIHPVIGEDPVSLPFPEAHFDAVLSCGVLEHVPDESGSLAEIRRVLQPQGWFFIYNLPQRNSYKEFLVARFGLGYTHARKYTQAGIQTLLVRHGFRVIRMGRGGMLPHTLTGMPASVQAIYGAVARSILFADRVFSRIPLINQLSQSLEIAAVSASAP